MSHTVTVVKASDIKPSGGQTEGMIRQNAIVDISDKICSSGKYTTRRIHTIDNPVVMIAKPHTASAVHHHGEESMKFL